MVALRSQQQGPSKARSDKLRNIVLAASCAWCTAALCVVASSCRNAPGELRCQCCCVWLNQSLAAAATQTAHVASAQAHRSGEAWQAAALQQCSTTYVCPCGVSSSSVHRPPGRGSFLEGSSCHQVSPGVLLRDPSRWFFWGKGHRDRPAAVWLIEAPCITAGGSGLASGLPCTVLLGFQLLVVEHILFGNTCLWYSGALRRLLGVALVSAAGQVWLHRGQVPVVLG